MNNFIHHKSDSNEYIYIYIIMNVVLLCLFDYLCIHYYQIYGE